MPSDDSGLLPRGLEVDRSRDVPIGVQIAWALRTGIREGSFRPGQRLPALRELAEETGVNVNTARAVYQRLQEEGFVDSQQGSGTFVVPQLERSSDVRSVADGVVREAQEMGVDTRELAAAIYVAAGLVAPADPELSRRRLLRTQIAALERMLAELEAECPGLVRAGSGAKAGDGPRLLDAVELAGVRAELLRRAAFVQGVIDERMPRLRSTPLESKEQVPARSRKSKAMLRTSPAPN